MAGTPRRFGDHDVLPLVDGMFELQPDMLLHAGGEAAQARMMARMLAGQAGPLQVEVNCFLLRGPDGITLIDSGYGTARGPGFGQARAALAALGIGPAQVDRVLLTHLHPDHAMGLLQEEAAWLPGAEILVPKAELDHFSDPALRAAAPAGGRGVFDIAAALRSAYGDRLRGFEESGPRPGIDAIPLPGHTPGHAGYLLRGLLIWGDMLHLGDLQTADPDIGLAFDSDRTLATATRHAGLARVADEGLVVAGGHVTGFNRVERAGAAFRLVSA